MIIMENMTNYIIYQHARHAMFSSVTFTSIATLAEVTETEDYVSDHCDRHRGHECFLPYFYGDLLLDKTLERLEAAPGKDSERAIILRKAIKCTRTGDHGSRGGHLSEINITSIIMKLYKAKIPP